MGHQGEEQLALGGAGVSSHRFRLGQKVEHPGLRSSGRAQFPYQVLRDHHIEHGAEVHKQHTDVGVVFLQMFQAQM